MDLEECSFFPNNFEVCADFDFDYDICGPGLADLHGEPPMVVDTIDWEIVATDIE